MDNTIANVIFDIFGVGLLSFLLYALITHKPLKWRGWKSPRYMGDWRDCDGDYPGWSTATPPTESQEENMTRVLGRTGNQRKKWGE